jgi:hypothetical protein
MNNFDELWPKTGEWLLYLGPTNYDDYRQVMLTHGNEYPVEGFRFITCADLVKIKDDNQQIIWVPLVLFGWGQWNSTQKDYFNV